MYKKRGGLQFLWIIAAVIIAISTTLFYFRHFSEDYITISNIFTLSAMVVLFYSIIQEYHNIFLKPRKDHMNSEHIVKGGYLMIALLISFLEIYQIILAVFIILTIVLLTRIALELKSITHSFMLVTMVCALLLHIFSILKSYNIAGGIELSYFSKIVLVTAILGTGLAAPIEETLQMSEQELKNSEIKYRRITENANDIILILNADFVFDYINEIPVRKTLGYSAEELIGKKVTPLLHPDDRNSTFRAFREAYEKGEAIVDSRLRHKNGSYVWLESKGRTLMEKNKKKVLVISRDVSERKEAEEALKRSENRFRDAYNRAEFYKDLIAHDINNILQSILFSSQLFDELLKETEKTSQINKILKNLEDQVQRGSGLINNVRKLSQLDGNEKQIVFLNLKGILLASIQSIKDAYSNLELEISMKFPQEDLLVQANDLIYVVFENILLNAVKHNRNPKVQIAIDVALDDVEGKNYVRIEIEDNGIGIEDDRKAIIFQRTYTAEKKVGGMGLGLSLVKKIVDSYRGKVWVEDKVQGDHTKGSKFIVLIPAGG
jgi:PAS domain S-box-containing protein